uniref:Uncharacterized protein n=1 Tax=Anguilla anguilla TaxID=7936 RepID=A0A0E9RHY5_ANGAN
MFSFCLFFCNLVPSFWTLCTLVMLQSSVF